MRGLTKVRKNIFIRLLIAVIGQITAALGIALLIKAGIGLGPVDAFNTASSQLIFLTVGTMTILFNFVCVIGQIVIWRKNLAPIQYLQFPVAILFGAMIDFFLIYVLTFDTQSYLFSWVVFIMGILVLTFSLGAINSIQVIFSPLEGFCQALASITRFEFVQYRWAADVILIILAFIFMLIGADSVLREGTIAMMVFFSPLLNFFMKKQTLWFQNIGLI